MASTTSSKATSMAELMAKMSSTPLVALKKGDYVKGTITKLTRREILIDLQAKGDALVLEKEPKILNNIMSLLKEGQEVEVSVLSPESESGQPIVSLRRFVDGLVWKHLEELKKSQEKVQVMINDVTKGGFVVSTHDGLSGFLPNSHTTASQGPLTQGKSIDVTIADLNREDNKIIFSQKTTMSLDEFNAVLKGFKTGNKVTGEISSVTNFGYFVLLHPEGSDKTIDGLIHISEVSWERGDDLLTLYKVGDAIEAVVIGIDRDARRVDLSLKKLTADPFEKLKELFPIEKQVTGSVVRTEDGNVVVSLGEQGQAFVEGIIKKDKVPPMTTYEKGQAITATVTAHDTRRRRIELTPVLKEKPLMYR